MLGCGADRYTRWFGGARYALVAGAGDDTAGGKEILVTNGDDVECNFWNCLYRLSLAYRYNYCTPPPFTPSIASPIMVIRLEATVASI
eukprot:scaffold77281_cov56-Attheya_sp.AAC.2